MTVAKVKPERAFLYGVLMTLAILAFVFAVLAPRLVFHRVLCTTWVKPGHTAVCRGYKGW